MASLAAVAASEIVRVFERAEEQGIEPVAVIVTEILRVRSGKIMVYGVGREGLMMRGLAMRLCHLGLDAHCVGDMNAPPLSNGDLFITSSGPGGFVTVEALATAAQSAGSRVVILTADSSHVSGMPADVVAVLPARTMADNVVDKNVILPMGSVYEGALFFLFELVIVKLRDELGQTLESMISRHTNME